MNRLPYKILHETLKYVEKFDLHSRLIANDAYAVEQSERKFNRAYNFRYLVNTFNF